jgi:hypothetical protein
MSLIKRSDVKRHLSTRARGILLFKSSSTPDVIAQQGNQGTETTGSVSIPVAGRGSQPPDAEMSICPIGVTGDPEASAPSAGSGKPRP